MSPTLRDPVWIYGNRDDQNLRHHRTRALKGHARRELQLSLIKPDPPVEPPASEQQPNPQQASKPSFAIRTGMAGK